MSNRYDLEFIERLAAQHDETMKILRPILEKAAKELAAAAKPDERQVAVLLKYRDEIQAVVDRTFTAEDQKILTSAASSARLFAEQEEKRRREDKKWLDETIDELNRKAKTVAEMNRQGEERIAEKVVEKLTPTYPLEEKKPIGFGDPEKKKQ